MKLKPEKLFVLVDTRERTPWKMDPMPVMRATLATGDYSLQALPDDVAIERKSIPDLVGCITSGRDRFERELERLKAYPLRAVIIEGTWSDLELGNYRSKLNPNSAVGSVCAWMARGVPFYFAGSPDRAGKLAARMMFLYAKRRAAELNDLNRAIS